MSSIIRLSIIAIALLISACNPTRVSGGEETMQNEVKVSVWGENGQLLSSILEVNKTSEIIQIIESRKPLMEKIMPIFTMQLIIERDGQQEVWLFSKLKYLKKKSKSESQVYFIEKQSEFAALINN